jgi:MSHA pilin protein MshD
VLPNRIRAARHARRQRGLTLIELLLFVAVVGVAVAGVLLAYDVSVRSSADPLLRKQAAVVAESLLNEVLAQPFSYCDPQDPANDADPKPASTAACTGGAAASEDSNGGTLGPQPSGESRFSASDPFDNVADYNGYTMNAGIYSLDDSSMPIPGLEAYSASISVSRAGLALGLASDDEALRVDVRVSGRSQTVLLTGYRLRHSPNATG